MNLRVLLLAATHSRITTNISVIEKEAVMYNRFAQHNELLTVEQFKRWYMSHYAT